MGCCGSKKTAPLPIDPAESRSPRPPKESVRTWDPAVEDEAGHRNLLPGATWGARWLDARFQQQWAEEGVIGPSECPDVTPMLCKVIEAWRSDHALALASSTQAVHTRYDGAPSGVAPPRSVFAIDDDESAAGDPTQQVQRRWKRGGAAATAQPAEKPAPALWEAPSESPGKRKGRAKGGGAAEPTQAASRLQSDTAATRSKKGARADTPGTARSVRVTGLAVQAAGRMQVRE